jgi:hypothetical protein
MHTYTQFESLVSSQRINRYFLACNSNEQKALALYKLNSQLAQNMFGVLALFEIVLRNKINQCYSLRDVNWLVDGFLHSSTEKDCINSVTIIENEKDKLRYNGKPITNDNILAKLSFGFWTNLFEPKQFRAGNSILLRIFTKRPKKVNQAKILNRLKQINLQRNRIAHHEPICFKANAISITEIETAYKNIVELITWLGINSQELFEGIDEIPLYLQKINTL